MGMRNRFWRFAHRRYQLRKPSIAWEILGLWFALTAGTAYAIAFWQDFSTNYRFLPASFLTVVAPTLLVLAHRRIRLERKKGSDALYRKVLETSEIDD